jgi:hypothetical protein
MEECLNSNQLLHFLDLQNDFTTSLDFLFDKLMVCENHRLWNILENLSGKRGNFIQAH